MLLTPALCILHSLLVAGSQPLSGLDLQDSWSAAGLAASASSAPLKFKLSMRPITTHVNVLLAGSSHYLGKAPYYSKDAGVPASVPTADGSAPVSVETGSAASDDDAAASGGEVAADSGSTSSNSPVDLHAAFLRDPAAWATQLPPVLLPEACREMVYTIQDSPGQGSTTDASYHIEVLLSHLLQQQAKDHKKLCGSMNVDTSLACGCLQHSTTACFYFLPPHGPSKLDLLAMSALSQHVALLSVLTLPEGVSEEQAQQLQVTVRQLLETPGAYVEGLRPIRAYKIAHSADSSGSRLQLPLLLCTPAPGASSSSLFESLMPLLTSNEVYGLLDDAWERYSRFCDDFEDECHDLDALARHVCSHHLIDHIPSLGVLYDTTDQLALLENKLKEKTRAVEQVQQQHQQELKEAADQAARLQLELDAKVADVKQQEQVIAALAAFLVGVVEEKMRVRGQNIKYAPRAEAALADATDVVGYPWKPTISERLKPKLLAAIEEAMRRWH
uniref:Uncharacterized protein n=1 Tax=Tetradesmus obliquus TaxID=3088 RepID=A0A383VX27_TETOB|eukprot:jgi/Sobl393_1/19740/SZX70017.1